jgi:hypothetical protein
MSALVEQCDVDEALRLHATARAAVDQAMGITPTQNKFGTVLNQNRVDSKDVLQNKVLEKTKEILHSKGGEVDVTQLVTDLKMRCECSEPDVHRILNHYIQMNSFMLNSEGTVLYSV